MFEEVTRSVAGLAFGLIVIGLFLTIHKRWQNGEQKSAKNPLYMGLHYWRFMSWILLGCVLGGLWAYVAGRLVAIVLVPIIWLQAKNPRPSWKRIALVSGISLVFASSLGGIVLWHREFLSEWILWFEAAVILSFIPQAAIGNPAQIKRYIRGPLNGETMYLHYFVVVNSAAWAFYGIVVSLHWMWVCYGIMMLEELIMIAIITYRRKYGGKKV